MGYKETSWAFDLHRYELLKKSKNFYVNALQMLEKINHPWAISLRDRYTLEIAQKQIDMDLHREKMVARYGATACKVLD